MSSMSKNVFTKTHGGRFPFPHVKHEGAVSDAHQSHHVAKFVCLSVQYTRVPVIEILQVRTFVTSVDVVHDLLVTCLFVDVCLLNGSDCCFPFLTAETTMLRCN